MKRLHLSKLFIGILGVGMLLSGALGAQTDTAAESVSKEMLLAANEPIPNVERTVSSTLDTPKVPKIELVFALDTTGSMSGLIETAQAKIWSIAGSMTQAEPVPEISIGLIAYRDRGDVYVTKITPLSNDLDNVYYELMQYAAEGGGDEPESVNQALAEGISRFEWSRDPNTYRALFLVGDSPPNQYANDISWKKTANKAAQNDIIINTIQMGRNPQTTPIWQEISRIAEGQYIQVDAMASGLKIATPYDDELGALADELDDSRIYYGSESEKRTQAAKKAKAKAISGKISSAAKARRGGYVSSSGKKEGYWGKKELIEDFGAEAKRVAAVKTEELPAEMQKMTETEKVEFVKNKQEKRTELKQKIQKLEKQRQEYIEKELSKREDKGEDNFSEKVYRAVKTQAKKKNIEFSGHSKH